jgi:hypothetical protein
MKKIVLALVLVFTFLLYAPPVYAATVPVVGEGIARKGDDEYLAKKLALDNAFKHAVATALSDIMSDDMMERHSDFLDSKVYSRTLRYVRNYKILSRGWITHFDLLEEVDEEGELSELGDNKDTSSTGRVLEVGSLDLDNEDEEKVMGAGRAPGTVVGVDAYHLKIEANVNIELLKKDVSRVASIVADKLRKVTLIVEDVDDFMTFERLKKKLLDTSEVKELTYESFKRGEFVMTLLVSAPIERLFDADGGELGGDYKLVSKEGGLGREKIRIRKAQKWSDR